MSRDVNAVLRGFDGLNGIKANLPGVIPQFPAALYKDGCDPWVVKNTDEENEARLAGYDSLTASAMANPYLTNWVWDLEDMSAKQLIVFAQDEYGVDLPAKAGQDTLFKAVCRLTREAPQNRNRLVLMGHTIRMQYDETLAEIRRLIDNPEGLGVESETTSFEVYL